MNRVYLKPAFFLIAVLFFMPSVFAKGKKDIEEISDPTIQIDSEAEQELTEGQEQSDAQEGLAPAEPLPPVQLYSLRKVEGDPVEFSETWGYVSAGREDEYNSNLPITDVCYFSAEINCYGELTSVPIRSKLKTGKARCHLVVVCDSRSLTHFVINPDYGVRKNLLKQIVKAAAPYDGVQIDFELVPTRDRKHFLTFIADLRYMLGQAKWFSVCVPARFKKLTDDVYPYAEIASYCDRVFVMAYDEHWSSSAPGPVASIEWCRKVWIMQKNQFRNANL